MDGSRFVEVPLIVHDKEEDLPPAILESGESSRKHGREAGIEDNLGAKRMKTGAESRTKRKRMADILEDTTQLGERIAASSSNAPAGVQPSSDDSSLLKLPPRRATRKQKRVQLKEIFSSCDVQLQVMDLPSAGSGEQGASAAQNELRRLKAGPEQAAKTLRTKQKTVKSLLSSTMETDHARCVVKETLVAAEPAEEWREINLDTVHPTELIGRRCKIFWPKDKKWYSGTIHEYRPSSKRHLIDYDDNEKEWIHLSKHRLQFRMTLEEETKLRASNGSQRSASQLDVDELLVLAHDMESYEEQIVHGSVVWAKVKGWPMWPALVMDEEHAAQCGLPSQKSSVAVQFFGSTDFARLNLNKLLTFAKGVMLKCHTKCKRAAFDQALKEVERYLKEGRLPEKMAQSLDKWSRGNCDGDMADDYIGDERERPAKASLSNLPQCPLDLGSFRLLSLGAVVTDSEHFHSKSYIWPENYVSVRKFHSMNDPNQLVDYRMEVIRCPSAPSFPTFRVVSSDSDPVEERTANDCWKKIYAKIDAKRKASLSYSRESGLSMFGFTNSHVFKLIQDLPNASACSNFTSWDKVKVRYKPIHIEWKHPERCSVCYVEEEYVDNLLLQCARCRIMVHMTCYGELMPPSDGLWLCRLCEDDEYKKEPPCCLCPITGGAMKRTTDERWAHLTCAMWIPETCLVDVKRMEPIDGLSSVEKERWKLLCSLCEVQYGACIQCAHAHCRVAYHPLCARASGLAMEFREDDARQVKLLSYCGKHGTRAQTKDKHDPTELAATQREDQSRSSGCSRCEPYDVRSRRQRQEPEARGQAVLKRQFVESTPYVVAGFKRNSTRWTLENNGILSKSICETRRSCPSASKHGDGTVLSLAERLKEMRRTLHQRLCFGKSGIHGWGIFTKQAHRAGDIVAEYTGEILRAIVADLREKRQYDSLVGAGTYIFRIDEDRVVDATRAGSIAHLINHSCEPNCYSRIITINREDHITICAKRDISAGEELTYDYRFASKGEELKCNCGARRCRGSVQSASGDNEGHRMLVPRSMLVKWPTA